MLGSRAATQPWRCLWRGSVQITRTTPLRRMILQLRQIFFTEANTFIAHSDFSRQLSAVSDQLNLIQTHLSAFADSES
jgi:hypothetical protein